MVSRFPYYRPMFFSGADDCQAEIFDSCRPAGLEAIWLIGEIRVNVAIELYARRPQIISQREWGPSQSLVRVRGGYLRRYKYIYQQTYQPPSYQYQPSDVSYRSSSPGRFSFTPMRVSLIILSRVSLFAMTWWGWLIVLTRLFPRDSLTRTATCGMRR